MTDDPWSRARAGHARLRAAAPDTELTLAGLHLVLAVYALVVWLGLNLLDTLAFHAPAMSVWSPLVIAAFYLGRAETALRAVGA